MARAQIFVLRDVGSGPSTPPMLVCQVFPKCSQSWGGLIFIFIFLRGTPKHGHQQPSIKAIPRHVGNGPLKLLMLVHCSCQNILGFRMGVVFDTIVLWVVCIFVFWGLIGFGCTYLKILKWFSTWIRIYMWLIDYAKIHALMYSRDAHSRSRPYRQSIQCRNFD